MVGGELGMVRKDKTAKEFETDESVDNESADTATEVLPYPNTILSEDLKEQNSYINTQLDDLKEQNRVLTAQRDEAKLELETEQQKHKRWVEQVINTITLSPTLYGVNWSNQEIETFREKEQTWRSLLKNL